MATTTAAVVWELAAAQRRVCTRAQLLERGLSASSVSRCIRSGLLRPLRPGLFVVGGEPGDEQHLAAALLVLPRSAASHHTAAAIHRFGIPPGRGIQVWVPRGGTHDLAPVTVRETTHLPDADVVVIDGQRVTSPARTIVDLAAVLRPRTLEHLVERRLTERDPSAEDLLACHRSAARRGRAGVGRLREVLDRLLDDEPFPESRLELALLRVLVEAGLPGFRRQYRPPWYDGRRGTVDFADPCRRVVLEADGRRWHSTSQAMAEDRRRDRLATRHGWRVLRFGWQEITRRPDTVAAEIAAVLATASAA